jgi:single-strand DNA-binding protein
MSHTVPFKLKKPASEFNSGDSTGFGIRCGIKVQDPKTKADEWANYEAVVFAKTPASIEFYRANLIEGALVVVSGEKILVKPFQGQQGLQITLALQNARVEAVTTGRVPDAAQQAYNQAQPQAQAPQPPAQQNGPAHAPPAGFDWPDDEFPA